MAEYRIDELAQAAGSTVRNVRAYQERGLLPPPRRQGRVAVYDETHLARLQLLGRLLGRGYTIANITELLTAWEHGRDLAEVLGLEQLVVSSFFTHDNPETINHDQLTEILDGPQECSSSSDELIATAVEIGLVAPAPEDVQPEDADRATGALYSVAGPRLLHAIGDLIAAGFSPTGALALAGQLQRSADDTAQRFAALMAEHLFRGRPADWMPSTEEIPEFAQFIHRVRPATDRAAHAALASALDRHVEALFSDYVDRLTTRLRGDDGFSGSSL